MKIKFNWGTGIAVAIMLFMAFILYFVIKVQSDHQYDNELVVEDYYKKELVFQSNLNKEQNAADLNDKVVITQNEEHIRIDFPKDFNPEKITGKVSLYRPSSQKLDFEFPLSISVPYLLIPKTDLVGGRWDIAIEWQYQGTDYINKAMLTL